MRLAAVHAMRTERPPPRRHSSHEIPTIVVPRERLPPVAASIDRDAETMVPCPCCGGTGMVTAEERVEWRGAFAEPHSEPALEER